MTAHSTHEGSRRGAYLLVLVPGDVGLRAVHHSEVTVLPILTLRHDLVAVLYAHMQISHTKQTTCNRRSVLVREQGSLIEALHSPSPFCLRMT